MCLCCAMLNLCTFGPMIPQVHCSRRHVFDCYRRHVLVATDNRLHAIFTRIHMAQILAFIMHSKYTRLRRVGAPRHSSSASDAEPAIFRNERLRLQSVGVLRHRSSASAAQPANFRSVMTDSVSELAPEQIWTIRPSHHQPPSTEFEHTHSTNASSICNRFGDR